MKIEILASRRVCWDVTVDVEETEAKLLNDAVKVGDLTTAQSIANKYLNNDNSKQVPGFKDIEVFARTEGDTLITVDGYFQTQEEQTQVTNNGADSTDSTVVDTTNPNVPDTSNGSQGDQNV